MKYPLTIIPMILFLTACGGGGGGDPGNNSGGNTGSVVQRIPDTGQTTCYYDPIIDGIYYPTEYTCLEPGSAWSPDGQDGYHSINPMSYTDNSDGTILDDVTRLTWQKCSIGRSGADCSIGSSTGYTWSNAKNQCANLNLNGTGWRLPTVFELTQIVSYGSGATIDSNVFPNTFNNYWSSTVHSNQVWAWYVNFTQNGITWANNQTELYNVRCVRWG